MSLNILTGNGEFLLNDRFDSYPEIIHAGKDVSKRYGVWPDCQIFENQDKNDLSNKTLDLVGLTLKPDDSNLVNCRKQTTTNHLTKSHHTITISSKVT